MGSETDQLGLGFLNVPHPFSTMEAFKFHPCPAAEGGLQKGKKILGTGPC